MKRSLPLLILALSAALAFSVRVSGDSTRRPAEDVGSSGLRQRSLRPSESLLFNGWGLTPAGVHVGVPDMPLKLLFAPDRRFLVAASAGFNTPGLSVIDVSTQRVVQFLPMSEIWNGMAFSRDGTRLFVSGGDSGRIHAFSYHEGALKLDLSKNPRPVTENIFLASLVVHPTNGKLYVCNEGQSEIWVIRPEDLELEAVVAVGPYPHTCVMGADRRHLYVSNWGGRSLSIVDTETNQLVRGIAVGVRPNDMALAPDGRLFVACAGDNTVHVIETQTLEKAPSAPGPYRRLWDLAREVLSTSLYPQSPEGSTPDALAVSPDGKTLFVANADNNDVMVANISDRSASVVDGFIPVGWYPTALAVTPDNQRLIVANGKGLQSRANFPPQKEKERGPWKRQAFDYIPTIFQGSISFIPRPDSPRMAAYTQQVRSNSPYTPETLHRAPVASDSVIPAQVGEACPIRHVLYIIKENRTYDQVFGDFKDAQGRPAGEGDPHLTIYGEPVTPNHHQLARDYVLLDNLYSNSEVSADGHSWCDAAMATDYNQRSWVIGYSPQKRHLPGNEEMETPVAGYLWDLCRRNGVSFRTYGEGAQRVPSSQRGRWSDRYGAQGSTKRDMDLVQWWIEDLHEAEKTGVLPRFTIMSLGEDHTYGTKPGAHTPEASVGSNDLGLGRIVEAASRSRFWKEMAIFVIEDDAQNGPDHIDAHRTVGLVISPYCKRGVVDSTLYTTASMVRTMELILGLPPLTQYDAGATPMFNCFRKDALLSAYNARLPEIDLFAKNTPASPLAKESALLDFDEYDRAPEDALNRILWAAAKGLDAPYPVPIHRAVFTRPPK